MSDLKASEFECTDHDRFEALVPRVDDPDEWPCPTCGLASPWRISAPMVRDKTRAVQAVTTGRSDPRPPGMLDTRKLGLDGQTQREWNKERDKEDREVRLKSIKKEFGSW